MCGIAAIVSAGAPASRDVVRAMMAALTHRGPDERDDWCAQDRSVAFGHVRLSVIDLERGLQPIANEDASTRIIANGEFYDFERLRSELVRRGHCFRTCSDAEVPLHLYEESGADCLRQLIGEFAFAIWDGHTQTLFAARDRFGIKPLFYAEHGGRVLIASEIKALFAAGLPAAWDDDGTFQSLHFCLHPDWTLYRGVRQVPPGHYLTVRHGVVRLSRYWDAGYPRQTRQLDAGTEDAIVDTVHSRIHEAVRTRTRADVPIACYLSGGVDSSSVLGIASRVTGKNVAAFTIAFDHPHFDESALAAGMAASAGVDFHPIRVSGGDFAEVFEDTVAQGEGLVLNGHGPARYILSREVKRAGYKVVLGGEGADEVFAGYRFARAALANSRGPALASLHLVRRLFAARTMDVRAIRRVSPLLAWSCRALGFDSELLASLSSRLSQWQALLHPDFRARHRQRDPYREFLRTLPWTRLLGRERSKIVLYAWLKSHFPNYVLAAERLDMAHGVELRLPFLDHRLFEYARGIPASLLYKNGQNKYVLRRAVAAHVTPRVLADAKRPFFAPPSTLSPCNPMTELLRDLVRGESFRDLPFFDRREVLAFVDGLDTLSEPNRASMDPILYLLASFAVLQRRYRPASP